jgi:hypothetical protein
MNFNDIMSMNTGLEFDDDDYSGLEFEDDNIAEERAQREAERARVRAEREAERARIKANREAEKEMRNKVLGAESSLKSELGLASAVAAPPLAILKAIAERTAEGKGQYSANPGLLGYPIAFIQIVRNQNYTPTNIDITSGEPSYSYIKLSKGLGYVRVRDCHLEIKGATQSELNKIESLLKGGVIL